jgi:hypothetical protein
MIVMTDREKLRRAFRQLRSEGYLARMNFWCCSTCGSYDLAEQADQMAEEGEPPKGAVFWHQQSDERAFKDGSEDLSDDLYMAHGLFTAGGIDTDTASSMRIVEVLREYDLNVEWDGNMMQTIVVKP